MNTDKGIVSARTAIWGMACLVCLVLLPLGAAAQKTPQTKSGFVTTSDGVRIHYLEAGKGSAILFVPGWTMPAWIWEPQMAHFAKTHRVVAMDPRSQGESSQTTEGHYPAARARDIKTVVDELELAPVVLVGWSLGVSEVVAYVDQFGTDTVAGLVLVDGDAGSEPEPALMKEFFGWTSGFYKDRRAATDRFVREMYKKPQSEEYYQRLIRASLTTPTTTAMALLLSSVGTNLQPALAKIDKPTLVVAAAGPWLRFVEDLHKGIPGSRFEVFQNAGHALFVDESERFNTLLGDFLRTLSP